MSEGQDQAPIERGYVVTILPTGERVRGEAGQTLFDALRAGGVPVGSACRGEGVCGRCALWVQSDSPLPPPSELERLALRAARAKDGQRLACQLYPQGALTARASYW
ncbi:MAG: (2Fe-2S)-binding protein [Deltaproteobacteria bacterium]|nr:(2Fe-2S)-binding protein [Deltaproteobacteria bacterium]MBK9371486.1 (2Fe-2S)-binding protein [Deltaproteobacteria bacterium]MBK9645559.1 (2Fe-2S)-binding protein [Deltaproteobacteria bacterium]